MIPTCLRVRWPKSLLKSPEGILIVDHHYYTFSSVFFYTDRPALLLNSRWNTMEYGSYAPGAPDVFIDDAKFRTLWLKQERFYVVANIRLFPDWKASWVAHNSTCGR